MFAESRSRRGDSAKYISSFTSGARMSLKKFQKILKNVRTSNPKKKMQAIQDLDEFCRDNPQYLKNLSKEITPLLEGGSERQKIIISTLLLKESKVNAKGMLKQFRSYVRILESAFDQKNQASISKWKSYINIILALGNIVEAYPKIGGKVAPTISKALMYPLYGPQNFTKERAYLYVTAVRTLGNIGTKNPGSVEESMTHVYKSLADSYRFDFWKKSTSEKDINMRLHATNVLKRVGRVAPGKVVPKLIPALNETNKDVVTAGKDILLALSKNIKTVLPALLKSMNTDKIDERDRVTEFIVELGKKHPDYVMPILTRALTDSRKNVRVHSISAMGSLLPYHTKYVPQVLPILIKGLMEEKDNEIKHSLADAVAIVSFLNINAFQKIMPYIIRSMGDDYYHVRWRMFQIVKNIGIFKPQFVVDALPHLITGLNDPYSHVQSKAKEALDALKVDKLEYLQAIKYISSSTRALEKAKKSGMACMEGQNALMQAIKAAKNYKFRESISLSTTALDMMEAAGVPLSRYDVGSRYVSGPYLGVAERGPEIPGDGMDGLPIPPPPEESIPLPPSSTGESPTPFSVPEAKEVELTETSAGAGIDEIFLMTTYGILIDHYVASKKSKVDEEILAGMLVAVKSFITDSFDLPDAVGGGKMNLNNIDFGDFSVILSTGKFLTMVAITTSGNKDAIYSHMTQGLDKIEKKYQGPLKTWDGDMEALDDLPEYMKEIILS